MKKQKREIQSFNLFKVKQNKMFFSRHLLWTMPSPNLVLHSHLFVSGLNAIRTFLKCFCKSHIPYVKGIRMTCHSACIQKWGWGSFLATGGGTYKYVSRGSRCAWWLPQNLVWDNKTYIEWNLEKLHGLKLWFGILKSPDYHCIRPSDKAWEWKTRFGNTYPALFMASVCGKITFCSASMKDWVSSLCIFVCDAWNKRDRWMSWLVNVLMGKSLF